MLQKGQAFGVEIKDVSSKGDVAGYGSVFNNVDQGYDVVEEGAFANSLKERGMPKMLFGHDYWSPPIGKWNEAKEDDHGLYLEGSLNLKSQMGSEVHAGLKMGTMDGLSVGFLMKDYDIAESGIRHIKEADLLEVSVVTFPMNELARVDAVKNRVQQGISKRELEWILRDAGFTRAQAKAFIARGFNGLTQCDAAVEDEDADFTEFANLFT